MSCAHTVPSAEDENSQRGTDFWDGFILLRVIKRGETVHSSETWPNKLLLDSVQQDDFVTWCEDLCTNP